MSTGVRTDLNVEIQRARHAAIVVGFCSIVKCYYYFDNLYSFFTLYRLDSCDLYGICKNVLRV